MERYATSRIMIHYYKSVTWLDLIEDGYTFNC